MMKPSQLVICEHGQRILEMLLLADSLQSCTHSLVVQVQPGGSQVDNDGGGKGQESASLGSDHNAKGTDERHAQGAGSHASSGIVNHRSGPEFKSDRQDGRFSRTQTPFSDRVGNLRRRPAGSPTGQDRHPRGVIIGPGKDFRCHRLRQQELARKFLKQS